MMISEALTAGASTSIDCGPLAPLPAGDELAPPPPSPPPPPPLPPSGTAGESAAAPPASSSEGSR